MSLYLTKFRLVNPASPDHQQYVDHPDEEHGTNDDWVREERGEKSDIGDWVYKVWHHKYPGREHRQMVAVALDLLHSG